MHRTSRIMDLIFYLRPSLPLHDSLLVIAGAGLACHVVFKYFEPRHPVSHIILLFALPGLLALFLKEHVTSMTKAITFAFAIYLTTLSASVAAYRLSPFHPLAQYPGPTLCKLSKLWLAWISSTGKQHIYYKMLHDQYGSIVRIGPNELSICDAGAIAPLMGPNGLPKGPIWEGRLAEQRDRSLIAMRDPAEHARRRRPWNRAFNTIALKDYEVTIAKRTSQLVSALSTQVGTVDIVQWISYFAYDFMSDMAFGGGSEMMRDGDTGGLWRMIESGQANALILGHIPWVGAYYVRLPGIGASLKKFRTFARTRAEIRRTQGSLQRDLFHHLMDEEGVEHKPPTMTQVVSDGGLAIVAGSDTTATALSYTIWNLLRSPAAYSRLQTEVDTYFPPGEDTFDATRQASMVYLNAVINEALRLLPPVLSGSQRAAAKGTGGKMVGPYFLPEGTSAFVHFYSLHRDPRNFSPMPDVFWPERWLQDQEQSFAYSSPIKGTAKFVHNTAAFIPFSFGPAVCVGKNLAYQEMRMVLCSILQKFDMRFADGSAPETWEETLRDFFVTMKGPLPVVLTPRGSQL